MEETSIAQKIDPKLEIIQLKKQVAILEQQLRLYEEKAAIGYYYELTNWQNQINDYIRSQKIVELIGGEVKEKKFERVMELIEQSKENVDNLKHMETLLGITGTEEKDKEGKTPTKDFLSSIAVKRNI